jgi:hypothetical protein
VPFNGSGTFSRVYSWITDAANGLNISATRMDTDTNDIANALSDCVTRDGQSPPTQNLPMNGHKLTGLANGSASTDSLAYGQVFPQTQMGAGTAAAPSYSFSVDPTTGIYADGPNVLNVAAGGVLVSSFSSTGWTVFYSGRTATYDGTTFDVTGILNVSTSVKVNGVQMLSGRSTGYTAMTGVANRATAYDTSTITLPQLAQRVKALLDDLTTNGIIGP